MALALCTADLHTLQMPTANAYVMCARSWSLELNSATDFMIRNHGREIDRALITQVECGTVLILWAFRVPVKAEWLMAPFAPPTRCGGGGVASRCGELCQLAAGRSPSHTKRLCEGRCVQRIIANTNHRRFKKRKRPTIWPCSKYESYENILSRSCDKPVSRKIFKS